MKAKILAIVLALVAFSDIAVAQVNYTKSKIVDLGLSVKWAGYNLDASYAEDYGGHYEWGAVTGTGSSPFNKDNMSGNMNICGDSRYDIARAKWGGAWRLPTAAEFQELMKKCTCYICKTSNGIWGLWCKASNGNSIFLPCAGEGQKDGGALSVNMNGWYWAGTTVPPTNIFGIPYCNPEALSAGRTSTGAMSYSMYSGGPTNRFSVRPVYDSSNLSNTNTPSTPSTPSPSTPKAQTATGFNFLWEQIEKWKELKNGTLAERSGAGVVIYGNNGYAYTGSTPEALKNKIVEINKANQNIVDLCVTDNGDYCIIFDGNGYSAKGPTEFLNALQYFNTKKEGIKSVALSDQGTWVVVGETNLKCSSTLLQFIVNARDKYGTVRSVSLSSTGGIVVCCERGVSWNSLVSNNVVEKIKETDFSIHFVKFTANGKYIITNGDKKAWYRM